MAWYYQTSPHDTHDWDSAQTPVLIDGDDQRQAAQARLDRGAQRLLLHRRSRHRRADRHDASTARRRTGRRACATNGAPDPNPGKEATIPGSLVSPVEGGVTNWPPPAYSPDTGLFYVNENNGFNIALPDRSRSARLHGTGRQDRRRRRVGAAASSRRSIRRPARVAWRYPYRGVNGAGGAGGLLTTGGGLLFAGDAGGNFVARHAEDGEAALALAHRECVERAADLHRRRQAARARRRRRHALRLHDVLNAARTQAIEGRDVGTGSDWFHGWTRRFSGSASARGSARAPRP